MNEVINFPGITRLDLDPDDVLAGAVGKLSEVVVIGFDQDGNDFFASSNADATQVHWCLARAQWRLMRMCDELEEGDD